MELDRDKLAALLGLTACTRCGALVGDSDKHWDWHKEVEPPPADGRKQMARKTRPWPRGRRQMWEIKQAEDAGGS